MKFPGSKLLHHWDLATQHVSLEDVLRSCQQVGLTGLAEVKFPQSVAMIFYYLGGEVNALYRDGSVAYHGGAALERLKARVQSDTGEISVYELPLDMAHLLRGITNRQRLGDNVRGRAGLTELLHHFERLEHTGTLELQLGSGAAMVLMVRGRISNTYWETTDGLTYEKGEARHRLELALEREEGQVFSSEFSREVWKSRHEVQTALRSRLEMHPSSAAPLPTEQLAAEETALRQQVLEEIHEQVPALIQTFLFDLMTGAVLARRGRGTSTVKVGLMAERVPAMTLYLRDLVASEDGDGVEVLELTTERVLLIVAIVDETQEAIALFADKSQPTALLSAALTRSVRAYAARVTAQ
jgi:hypothetical protein